MKKNSSKKAFTLVELSIVLLIASILITGLLSVSVNSINNSNTRITNERIREIYKAIGNYLMVNKRLPCPASFLKVKSVDSDYGTEIRGGSSICGGEDGVYRSTTESKLFYGMLPIKTLGLSNEMAEDGFGSRFTYIVDEEFAGTFSVSANFGSTYFSTADSTDIMTINEKQGATTQTVTIDAIMAIISHGINKAGAFNPTSALQNTRSTDADEMNNDAVGFNESSNPSSAVFDKTLISVSTNSDLFDDIVFFKRRNDLVEDFEMMHVIPCENATGTGFVGTQDAYYGQMVFGSDCPVPANGKYSKKCETYGTWLDVNGC